MTDTNDQFPISSYTVIESEPRRYGMAFDAMVASSQVELETGFTRLRRQHTLRKRQEKLHQIDQMWPVWAGVVIACLAPAIYALVAPLGPWGVRVLFPLVALAGYHGLRLGAAVSSMLPQILLYLQFPAEGLLAMIAVRRRVTFAGVAGQVCFFHFLAFVGLWLLRDALAQ